MSITLYLDDSERRKLDILYCSAGLGLSAHCQDRINAAYFAHRKPGWKLPDFKTVGIEYHTGFEASEMKRPAGVGLQSEKGVSRAKWCRLRLMQLVQADIDSGYSCPKSRMGETASGQEEKDAINRGERCSRTEARPQRHGFVMNAAHAPKTFHRRVDHQTPRKIHKMKTFPLNLTEEAKARYKGAAHREEKNLSEWMREKLDAACEALGIARSGRSHTAEHVPQEGTPAPSR